MYFGKVSNQTVTISTIAHLSPLDQDVEEKGLHVIVEGLVIEEHFGEQTERLTVRPLPSTVNFKD